ncbi:two-component system response regulator YesN [Paenibacillus endophyticus]|uniref:Two-component system response regulator YesN n=1 Tax=Paenibacillus endophyticus TaxID=1294268 RepID=A0A7W5CD67_9BACL|nr:response regulator [Paenibacillus endophyticus]MBB3155553.1 two-component system response regulator YesN [Paenibacillus endophyticus]
MRDGVSVRDAAIDKVHAELAKQDARQEEGRWRAMYKLLIVDDEPTVRAGLRSYFDWAAYGIDVGGEADDGDVALEMIARDRPDLILTDVRMPSMDGITMSQRISEEYPSIKIIFVSGHDDADYLKSAMKVSAVDYIFKPVNLQELSTVIKRVVADLDAESSERIHKQELLVKLKEGMPLLREKFLLSMIGEGAPKSELAERVSFLGLNLPVNASYWVMVVSVDDLADVMASRSERDRQLLWYSVLNIYQELLDAHMRGYVFEHRIGEFVGVLQVAEPGGDSATEAAEALFALAGDLRSNLERWLKIGATIGISDLAGGLSGLARAYKQAREAADYKWYLGKNRIITMDSLEGAEPEDGALRRYDYEFNEKLISALKADDEVKVGEAVESIFASLSYSRPDGLKYGRNLCLQLVLAIGQLLMELGTGDPELEAMEAELTEALYEKETLRDMRRLIESYLATVGERIREKRTGKVANVVERVRAYIELNYANGGLTVADIGKAVYLSSTYVSLLFKQETGQTVGEYLTQVRVDKAKVLLLDPQYKFYDICYAIGYTDPSYFTKLFKKVTGATPSAYRDSHG